MDFDDLSPHSEEKSNTFRFTYENHNFCNVNNLVERSFDKPNCFQFLYGYMSNNIELKS